MDVQQERRSLFKLSRFCPSYLMMCLRNQLSNITFEVLLHLNLKRKMQNDILRS